MSRILTLSKWQQGDSALVLTEFIPEYYRQFQCIGGACEDTCCQGWTVDVDKTSYKRLMRDSQPEIRGIARNNLKLENIQVFR